MSTTWCPAPADGATALERVAGNRPAYAAALRDVEVALWGQDVVEATLLELCRRRIGQLLGGDSTLPVPAAAPALDPVLVEHLRQWPTAPEFDARQRTGLGFAEQVAIDAQGVSDEHAARVIDEFGDDGFLVLAYACGFFETTARAELLLTEGGRQ